MPFGLRNAPATYQRALDMFLTKFKWKSFLFYMDDVIIYWDSIENHICHVGEILTTVAEFGVNLKMKKCTLFIDKVEWLGHVVRPGKLKVGNTHTTSLRQAKPFATKCKISFF